MLPYPFDGKMRYDYPCCPVCIIVLIVIFLKEQHKKSGHCLTCIIIRIGTQHYHLSSNNMDAIPNGRTDTAIKLNSINSLIAYSIYASNKYIT